jgi:hypothetical protein
MRPAVGYVGVARLSRALWTISSRVIYYPGLRYPPLPSEEGRQRARQCRHPGTIALARTSSAHAADAGVAGAYEVRHGCAPLQMSRRPEGLSGQACCHKHLLGTPTTGTGVSMPGPNGRRSKPTVRAVVTTAKAVATAATGPCSVRNHQPADPKSPQRFRPHAPSNHDHEDCEDMY